MSQVDSAADAMVDLEVAGHKDEGGHVVTGAPGGGVWFEGVDGVVARHGKGGAQEGGFFL